MRAHSLSVAPVRLHLHEFRGYQREVLRTQTAAEKPIGTRDNRWFTVRIMPYRTVDDRVDGVVITFTDITAAKVLEAKLRNKQSELESHVAGQAVELERRSRKRRAKP